MKRKTATIVTQVHTLHEVLNYFAKGFDNASLLDAFVDTAKGKVIFQLIREPKKRK